MNTLEKEIYATLKKPAIDIIDEYEGTVSTTTRWKLAVPRTDGTSHIGLLNLWLAVKHISFATNTQFDADTNIDSLTEICDNLVSYKLLVEDPLHRREKFKLITNEELNAKREERGPYSRPNDDKQTGIDEIN
jgi:hypothetical protein